MSTLESYPQIAGNHDLLALLEVIGCTAAHDFISYDCEELHAEMGKANSFLGLELQFPDQLQLQQLQQQLAKQLGVELQSKPKATAKAASKKAEPLQQARLLSYDGPKQQDFLSGLRQAKLLSPEASNLSYEQEEEESCDNFRDSVSYQPKKISIFTPRGVTSLHPRRSYLSALVVVAWHVALLCSMVSGMLIYSAAGKVPLWFYGCVVGTLMLGVVYLFLRMNCPCSICRQPILNKKKCKYHRQAHKVWGMSVTFCTAVHILFTRWFRCPYCGTSQRLDRRKK